MKELMGVVRPFGVEKAPIVGVVDGLGSLAFDKVVHENKLSFRGEHSSRGKQEPTCSMGPPAVSALVFVHASVP